MPKCNFRIYLHLPSLSNERVDKTAPHQNTTTISSYFGILLNTCQRGKSRTALEIIGDNPRFIAVFTFCSHISVVGTSKSTPRLFLAVHPSRCLPGLHFRIPHCFYCYTKNIHRHSFLEGFSRDPDYAPNMRCFSLSFCSLHEVIDFLEKLKQ